MDGVAAAQVLLKKRYHDIETKATRALKIRQLKVQKRKKPDGTPSSAESICNKAQRKRLDLRRHKRLAKYSALPKVRDSKCRVLLVVRNHQRYPCREVKEKLDQLRLKARHSAVFLSNDKESLATLRLVEPFVFYGRPSVDLLRRLICTRAKLVVESTKGDKKDERDANEQKKVAVEETRCEVETPLTDNNLVEEHFGDCGLLCTEDLVNELYTCGDNFAKVIARLRPFQLESLRRAEGIGALPRHGHQPTLIDLISKVV